MNAPFTPEEAARALGGHVIGRDKVRAPSPGNGPKDSSFEIRFGSQYADGFTVNDYYGGGDGDWKFLKDFVREKVGKPWEPSRKDGPAERMNARVKDFNHGPQSARPKQSRPPDENIVQTYDYTEADGRPLYQAVRYEPKDFRQRQPDGRGGWFWKSSDRSVLYRWADLIKYPDATIFVCEGEKDTDRLASLGHCATTIDGRGKWTSDCIAPLKGRDVFVLEDNDEKGQKRALSAAKALHGTAGSLRIVRLPGLEVRGDVSDWLDADPSRASELVDICRSAPEWEPSAEAEADDFADEFSNAEGEESKLQILATPYTWRNPDEIPLRQWLYGHLLIRKFVTATVSPGGTGKSSLVATETMAQVAGKDLLGVLPAAPLRVWLWNLEDPQEETERKLQAAALYYKINVEDIGDRLFVDSGRDKPLVIAETLPKSGAVIVKPVTDALVEEIKRRKIDVVVIDPFVSCHHVPENDNGAQDLVVKEWGRVAELGNCAVHLVDHTRKMGPEGEVTTESARGGKAKTDACRVVRAVNRMTKEEGEKAGVDNFRLHFRTINDKANLQPPADKSDWFRLESVPLGNGPLGSPGDSVGVVTTWNWPDPLAGLTGADFERAAAKIRSGKWRENAQAKDWVGKAVAEAMDINVESKSERAKVSGMIKAWLSAGSLVVVEGEDEKRMPRKFVEVRGDV